MKSQKLFKLAALVLSLVMCLGVFAACAPKSNEPTGSEQPGTSGDASNSQEGVLSVGYEAFHEGFSPFFATEATDNDVVNMVMIAPLKVDREGNVILNGIEGETVEYNDTPYTYVGPADIKVERINQDKEDEQTVYTIKLKEGIKFADGQDATIDDLIFSFYVELDSYYDGAGTLASCNVQGYEEYRYNDSKAGQINPAEELANIDDNTELQEWVKENVINPTLDGEAEWVEEIYDENHPQHADFAGAGYFDKYPVPKDLLYALYTLEDEPKDTTDMTKEEIVADLKEQYGYDYETLGNNYGADFTQKVTDAAYEIALEKIGRGDPVPNVSGIKKIDDYTVSVTCDGFAANAIYQVCGTPIAPLHYYGSEDLYDYDNNQFGFETRTEEGIARVKDKTSKPMGAGPYNFVEYKNRVVYFEANEYYYLGAPKIKYLQFVESPSNELVSAVAKGSLDIATPSGSLDRLQEIASYNTDTNETDGDHIFIEEPLNVGYGYIGICAGMVNVGGERGSDASKSLRKALATVLAVYRSTSVNSYYGDAATVIEYPISDTSWAAPRTNDEGYSIAFSVDKDGNPIYSDGMTDEQRYDAALQAALGFFEEAGYTVENGKLTAAPEGASLSYTLNIVADNGDHPVYSAIQMASEALATIGFELKINAISGSNQTVLWDMMGAGKAELWAAAWTSTIDPDMYQVYYSINRPAAVGGATNGTGTNYLQITDDELDKLILEARNSDNTDYRKTVYLQCFDILRDWAVEVPAYQRKNLVIFSTERINRDTLVKDITPFYGWADEIQKLELN